jgi:hypothetical protein
MKHTVGGPLTDRGVELGGVWPGDPDYSFTSLIVSTIDSMNLKKKVVSFTRLCEAVGTWSPHNDPGAPVYRLMSYGPHNVRVALTRFGYQVIK